MQLTRGLIRAGTDANSACDAYVVSSLTACVSGAAASAHLRRLSSLKSLSSALMERTRFAVQLATSLADCTKWRLATGLVVFAEAVRQVLHRADVCFAITVAAFEVSSGVCSPRGTLVSYVRHSQCSENGVPGRPAGTAIGRAASPEASAATVITAAICPSRPPPISNVMIPGSAVVPETADRQ